MEDRCSLQKHSSRTMRRNTIGMTPLTQRILALWLMQVSSSRSSCGMAQGLFFGNSVTNRHQTGIRAFPSQCTTTDRTEQPLCAHNQDASSSTVHRWSRTTRPTRTTKMMMRQPNSHRSSTQLYTNDNTDDRPNGNPSSSRPSNRVILATTALTLLGGCIVAGLTGLLPGYTKDNHQIVLSLLLLRDVASTLFTATLGYVFVQIVTSLVTSERLEPSDARKIIHTLSAPLFVVFWPLFSDAPGARVLAAVVPILNGARLVLASQSASGSSDDGGGSTKNNNHNHTVPSSSSAESALARAVSRSGDAKEAIGGPFVYVLVMAVSILLFWRDSCPGIVALSALAAGDGMADLVGRRYGKYTYQWKALFGNGQSDKSLAGTLAFWVASSVTGTALLWWMQATGCLVLPTNVPHVAVLVTGIMLVSALCEVVPFADDNYTVPLSAGVLAYFVLGV